MSMSTLIAQVIVKVTARKVDKPFDYIVPDDWLPDHLVGCRVLVPFQNRRILGYVIHVYREDEDTADAGPDGAHKALKTLLQRLDDEPILTSELLDLARFLSYRYAATHLQAIETMLPAAFRMKARGPAEVLSDRVGPKRLGLLMPAGALRDGLQAVREARLVAHGARRQWGILESVEKAAGISLSELGLTASNPSLRALLAAGLVQLEWREFYRDVEERGPSSTSEESVRLSSRSNSTERTLTSWQERALRRLTDATAVDVPNVFLLHGVTGSGKTEVYLRVIEAVLAEGCGAIVLVPEIALTPQMVRQFTERFGNRVALLHSLLSVGERRDEWMRLRRGDADIAVGARSAIFAPVQNLRFIVMDEEHESTYKQEESPRYSAHHVALERARQSGATVVFGSATPSLYAMHLVETGIASLLTMPERANRRPLPPVEVVDMREELRAGHTSLFSRALESELRGVKEREEQAILFLNRRGFASFLLCRQCGEGLECPHCSIALTVHRHGAEYSLHCHYCGYVTAMPEVCPTCKEDAIRPYGLGTQQVESALQVRFPELRALRMDVDTTRRKGAHKRILDAFARREADVLIGTQMIAKGLDFPRVTLVGVISADTLLSIPDFRSEERAFQLLTQVAGRAGRAEAGGKTIVQTYRPTHFVVSTAAAHDYASFYRREREQRERYDYPPFCELAAFLATHSNEAYAKGAAERFVRELQRTEPPADVTILPATPALLRRKEDQYRYQVVVKYPRWNAVRDWMVTAFAAVHAKMNKLGGTCTLDVSAGRIG